MATGDRVTIPDFPQGIEHRGQNKPLSEGRVTAAWSLSPTWWCRSWSPGIGLAALAPLWRMSGEGRAVSGLSGPRLAALVRVPLCFYEGSKQISRNR